MSTVAALLPSRPQPSHSGPGSVLESGVQTGGAGCQRGCEEEGPTPVACPALPGCCRGRGKDKTHLGPGTGVAQEVGAGD